MKKIFYVFALFCAVSFAACGNKTTATASIDTDTVAVDSVDSVAVDSVVK